ncbi:MAG: PD-(D/E)XK nuclease family protein, partial [Anaerolineaceae bacterium]|nr:PD-(D/E)XK nuclease family protein [Anaerolineaceae bacterium]
SAGFALELLNALGPLVDRLPVAEVIQQVVNINDYRAILAAGNERMGRNLDKLLEDAHASGMLRVRDFLEYLATLRDVGAREGEASPDARGAVQLMTIHKAKGLEFKIVVLADAARHVRGRGEPVYLFPETGLAPRLDRLDSQPLLYRIAGTLEKEQTDAEERRLLYVALTRAQEKVIISAHIGRSLGGFLAWILDGLLGDPKEGIGTFLSEPGKWHVEALPCGQDVRFWISSEAGSAPLFPIPEQKRVDTGDNQGRIKTDGDVRALDQPILAAISMREKEPDERSIPARVTGRLLKPSPAVIGTLVHRAIQRWCFPGNPRLDLLLETAALEAGLVNETLRLGAVGRAKVLLSRFKGHPLWAEMDAAERRHEVPYAVELGDGEIDRGLIDVLYRVGDGWRLVDFKSDAIYSREMLESAFGEHQEQMMRYKNALGVLMSGEVRAAICFLDDRKRVTVSAVNP